MPSKDPLAKLFDVEHEAQSMVSDARVEGGRRLDAAKTRAQKYYSEAYDAALARALAAREKSDADSRREYEEAIAEYRKKLESSHLDRGAFSASCDKALEEGL
jgi:vacuolar-type H+-ATPase subunit H